MRHLALVPVVALALVSAGCGGSGTATTTTTQATTTAAAAPMASPAAQELIDAVTTTAAQPISKLGLSGRLVLGTTMLNLNGSGVYDTVKEIGSYTLTLGGGSGNTSVEEIFNQETIWLRSPLIAGALPAGKQWIKIDLATSGATLGFDFKGLTAETPADVFGILARVTGATKVGSTALGGLALTHYKVTVRQFPATDPIEQLTHAVYAPVDAWIDKDGFIRRVALDYRARLDPAKPKLARVLLTMDFLTVGGKVAVSEPPAAQVESGDSTIGGNG